VNSLKKTKCRRYLLLQQFKTLMVKMMDTYGGFSQFLYYILFYYYRHVLDITSSWFIIFTFLVFGEDTEESVTL
jgi:hypothetical protein